MRLFIKWAIIAVALLVTAHVVPGITVEGANALLAVVVTAAILGLLNVFVKPLLMFFSCGCIVATLGLFIFVINGIVLLLASWIAQNWFGISFRVDGIMPAIIGSIVVSIVSFVLNMLVSDKSDK